MGAALDTYWKLQVNPWLNQEAYSLFTRRPLTTSETNPDSYSKPRHNIQQILEDYKAGKEVHNIGAVQVNAMEGATKALKAEDFLTTKSNILANAK